MTKIDDLLLNGVIVAAVVLLAVGYFGQGEPRQASAPVAMPESETTAAAGIPVSSPSLEQSRTVYVPAYSVIPTGSGRTQIDLATTLTVHNTSQKRTLIVQRISYFDTNGLFLQDFLKEPVGLPPLATTQAVVPAEDRRGGVGANFIVEWASEGPITEPVIEAVMIGSVGGTSSSFVSHGRPLKVAP